MPATGFPDARVPVVLTSHAEELLATDADAILRYLHRGTDVPAVAATLVRTRRLRRHRAVVRAGSIAELTEGLQALSTKTEHPMVARSSQTSSGKTAFVFPGQGNQWPSMGTDAYDRSPVYRAQVDECADAFVDAGHISPLRYLTAHTGGGDWSQVEIQGAQFTHAVGLSRVWQSCGVAPDITVGHSLGEVAAAYVAGRMKLSDAVAVVVARAKAVDRLQGDYRMAALGMSIEAAQRLIASVDGWLEVSAVNSPSSIVVSGQRDAVTALVTSASGQGMFARELDVNYPGHTSALEALRDDLALLLPDGQFADAPVQFIGSATGQAVPAGTDYGDYWYRNLRDTVRFDRAVAAARRHGATRFVELSAHASLLFALEDLTDGAESLIVGSGRRDEPLVDTLSAGIAAVAVTDPAFSWADLADRNVPVLQGFPNAPMRSVHMWAKPEPLAPVFGLTVSSEKWEQRTELAPVAGTIRRIAVVDLLGPDSALSTKLRDVLQRHPDAEPAAPGDADLVLAVAPLLDHPDAEVAAQQIGRLVGDGLLDYADAGGAGCRDVCLVTVGGEHVRLGEPVALPAQAALAAMHRSIGFERPDHAFRHLDLPTWEIDDGAATAVIDAARGGVHEGAIRDSGTGSALFVRTLPEPGAHPQEWKLDDGLLENIVITGGSGAVGLHFARYLLEHGARRLILLSRSGVDAATVAELKGAATVSDADIIAPACDLRLAEQVSAVAREHGGDGASLLIHAAGAAHFEDFKGVSTELFADTAAAKIGGLARMTELWPLRSDTRILVCSSVSGVWGGRGHAAYSAANRMLDVMAGQLRAKGQHCVALRYGLWRTEPGRGSGITERAGVSAIERAGLLPMTPASAVAASLRDHVADPLIMTADPDRLRTFLDSQTTNEARAAAPSEIAASGEGPARIVAEVAAVLSIDAATIDRQTSLLDLGLDSLLALDLRKRLRRATGASVPLGTLLGGITSAELIAELDTRSQKVETTRD